MHGLPTKMRKIPPHSKILRERGLLGLDVPKIVESVPVVGPAAAAVVSNAPGIVSAIPIVGPVVAPVVAKVAGPTSSPTPTPVHPPPPPPPPASPPAPPPPPALPAPAAPAPAPAPPPPPPPSSPQPPPPPSSPPPQSQPHTNPIPNNSPSNQGGSTNASNASGSGVRDNGPANIVGEGSGDHGSGNPTNAQPDVPPGQQPPAGIPGTSNGSHRPSGSPPLSTSGAGDAPMVSRTAAAGDHIRTIDPTSSPAWQAAVNIGGNPGLSDGPAPTDAPVSPTSAESGNGARPTEIYGDKTPSAGGLPLGGGDNGADGHSGDGGGLSSGSDAKHGLPKGAIAGIAIGAFLLTAFLLLCLARSCYSSKRSARRKKWFFGTASATNYGFAAVSSDTYFGSRNNRTSQRSSFGTTIDRGQSLLSPEAPETPAWPFSSFATPLSPVFPTMSHSTSSRVSVVVPTAASPVADTLPSPVIRTSVSESEAGSSLGATYSSEGSQYLIVPETATLKGGDSSPISVHPFSPSERWSFPKPPNQDKVSRTSALTYNDSNSTLRPSPYSSGRSFEADSSTSEGYQTATENPFADFVTVDSHLSGVTSVDASNADHFAEVEIVRRPFVPTMPDEIGVNLGDEVKVRKRFDDGWAYAEKVSDGRRGLFPIDCLRAQDEDLPAFLASKRISSYSGAKELLRLSRIGTAV